MLRKLLRGFIELVLEPTENVGGVLVWVSAVCDFCGGGAFVKIEFT